MAQRMPAHLSKRKLLLGLAVGIVLASSTVSSVLIAAPALLPWTLDPRNPRVSLTDVEHKVIRRYRMPQITPASLVEMLAIRNVTLFDIRTLEEFEAGHLPDAIRVEPGASVEDIINLHSDKFADGPVVFYCSVGVRSSSLMRQMKRRTTLLAKSRVYNLRGGIFRWAAEGRVIVRDGEPGATHPFNEDWGELLARTLRDQKR